MPIQTLDASIGADEAAAVLERDGCAIVRDLVPASLLDRVHEELRPWLEATRSGNDEFTGQQTRRTGSLCARSVAFQDLALHPLVLATARQVLSKAARRIQLHLTQIIDIGPGESSQDLHRDQWAFDEFPFPIGVEVECQTLWAMTDFREENGATRVIPGSHRWDHDRKPDPAETLAAEMKKGSLFLYTGAVYHGGGANRSAENRLGVNVGYTTSWLRQEENQYLSVPPSVAADLPVELQKLLGYARGGYALGYYGDLQDPREAIAEAAARKTSS